MLKDVSYPIHVFHGIRPLMRDYPQKDNIRIFGGDTETCRGHAHTVQIVGPEDSRLIFVNDATIFDEFWGYIRHWLRPKGVNICYFHHLNFDLRVLFALHHLSMYEQYNDIELTIGNVEVKMLFGKVNTATIKEGPLTLRLFDSRAFTMTSLAKSLKMYNIPESKLPMPEGLGKKRLRTKEFRDYAMQDTFAERALGLQIMKFHEAYSTSPSITLPSYTSKVFRRHFLKPNDTIPFPPVEIVKAAELSYHGGKNDDPFADPIVLEDVFEADISSAYPFAMCSLPPMTKGNYYETPRYDKKNVGIYSISGRTPKKRHPLVYNHTFDPISPNTEFSNLWHTCYEVEEILNDVPGVKIEKGYVWIPDPKATQPFRDYVNHFYNKKQSSKKDDPFYAFYKYCLNQLYGKMVSTIQQQSMEALDEIHALQAAGVEIPDSFRLTQRFDPVMKRMVQVQSQWKAGGMYNPFWASLVTGHTRAYIYRLEKKLSSFHSATDSVKSFTTPKEIPGLGGIKTECFGRCYLFRNKLYLHCSHDGQYCGHKKGDYPYKYPEEKSAYIRKRKDGTSYLHPAYKKAGKFLIDTDGQHLCKVALHGFKGQVWELWYHRHSLLKDKKLKYSYQHVIGLREGLRQQETPCDFVARTEVLKLGR